AGTTAGILSGAVVETGDLNVVAVQNLDYLGLAGGAAGGIAAIGLGLQIVNIEANTVASIGADAVITGENADSALKVSANLDSDIQVYSVAGALSGTFSLGAAVALVNDSSSANAFLRGTPISRARAPSQASNPHDRGIIN